MKKLLLILTATLILSCSTEENGRTEQQADCNCDRVVEVNYFNIASNPMQYLCVYYTINDCTQVQKQKDYTTTDPDTLPQLGQCR